jgi:hypothetical protein
VISGLYVVSINLFLISFNWSPIVLYTAIVFALVYFGVGGQ